MKREDLVTYIQNLRVMSSDTSNKILDTRSEVGVCKYLGTR